MTNNFKIKIVGDKRTSTRWIAWEDNIDSSKGNFKTITLFPPARMIQIDMLFEKDDSKYSIYDSPIRDTDIIRNPNIEEYTLLGYWLKKNHCIYNKKKNILIKS